MANNTKQSWKAVVDLAVDILHDSNSSSIQRSLAWSVISQTNTNNQTSAKMEQIASKVLQSDKYNDNTKSLAWSILSQSNKYR